jgi:type IV secretory pathway VirB2 component (pilin)
MKNNLFKVLFVFGFAGVLVFAFTTVTFAAGSGMPWEGPIQKILDSITGPVAKAIGILAIVATGIGFGIAEEGNWLKKGLAICFGLSIAFSATTFFLPMFGFSGGIHF